MTVDEILAEGWYMDRRGKGWERKPSDWWWYRFPSGRRLTPPQMRLLIERDLHECDSNGLTCCTEHPAVSVILNPDTGFWLVFDRYGFECVGPEYREWSDALDAARALAVGE